MPTGEFWSPELRNCAYCKQVIDLRKGDFFVERDSRRKRRYHRVNANGVQCITQYLLKRIQDELTTSGKTQEEIQAYIKSGAVSKVMNNEVRNSYLYVPRSETSSAPVSSYELERRSDQVIQEPNTEVIVNPFSRRHPIIKKNPNMEWLTGSLGKKKPNNRIF